MSNSDDDVVTIALWIIAIGFVILAIEKTTKLSRTPDTDATNKQPVSPPTPDVCLSPAASEDQQLEQIASQIAQLKESMNKIKKDLAKDKNSGKDKASE